MSNARTRAVYAAGTFPPVIISDVAKPVRSSQLELRPLAQGVADAPVGFAPSPVSAWRRADRDSVPLRESCARSGVDKCWRWSAAQGEVAASGLPWPLLHLVTVVVQLGGGFFLLLGIEPRLGALLLLLFLIPVTVMYHPFWKRSGADFVTEADHFLSLAQLLGCMAAALGVAR